MTSAEVQLPAVILCGGISRRMAAAFRDGSGSKPLLDLDGQPMVAHVIGALRPQAQPLLLNVNGEPRPYAAFGLPVIADRLPDFLGPLAGLLAGIEWAAAAVPQATRILSVTGDSPMLPPDLAVRLLAAAEASGSGAAIAQSLGRQHPVIGVWPVSLHARLRSYLTGGGRKVMDWARDCNAATAEFAPLKVRGRPVDPFINVNTPEDLRSLREIVVSNRRAVIGLAGWKDAGKTTLAERLIERFTARGLRVSSIKHTHHPEPSHATGTDTSRHAAAGASPVVLIGPGFWTIDGLPQPTPPPELADALALMPPADVILVEGFRHAAIPKIEVRRDNGAPQPALWPNDPNVIVIASASPGGETGAPPVLPIDAPDTIAGFIVRALAVKV